MKNLVIVFISIGPFLTSCVHAQEISQQNVPSVVNNSFSSVYPNATDIEWERNGQAYDVEFKVSNKEHHIWYNADGKIMKHKTKVQFAEIPAAVIETLTKEFSSFKIDEVDLVEEKEKIIYVIELDSDSVDRIVHLSADGKVLDNFIDR